MRKVSLKLALALCALSLIAGCDQPPRKAAYTAMTPEDRARLKEPDTVLGEPLFTTNKRKKAAKESGALGVNAYLWRASLDTLSFMPLATLEPFSGAIMTEWYTPPGVENERMKVTVIILDRELRPDGLRVSVFHQVHDPKKGWMDVTVTQDVPDHLERTILTRARSLKYESNIK